MKRIGRFGLFWHGLPKIRHKWDWMYYQVCAYDKSGEIITAIDGRMYNRSIYILGLSINWLSKGVLCLPASFCKDLIAYMKGEITMEEFSSCKETRTVI